ncbi:regulator of G-protein signaling 20-like isoform X1 [Paramormyrops kingsleyae]|uniref:regulator of G-protein signaling 20-like isoform X1 n=1 Tax=Paramormyrops kingsleyae TaxID=1676925 RepID=UPI003B973FC1
MRRRLSHQDAGALPSCSSSPEASPCSCALYHRCLCWSCCCLTSRSRDQACSRRDSNMSSLGSLQRTDESGRLSLTEVSSWALSFTALMESPAGRRIFMEFLCSEHSDENMLFWQACESLKTETRRTAIGERAKQIYLDYISILSPKEVSIDATVRETINGNMAAPTVHIFDDAQAQIYALMHRDSYPRFLNSLLYQSLLQSLGPISPTSNT